jgi:hypothetical protein
MVFQTSCQNKNKNRNYYPVTIVVVITVSYQSVSKKKWCSLGDFPEKRERSTEGYRQQIVYFENTLKQSLPKNTLSLGLSTRKYISK